MSVTFTLFELTVVSVPVTLRLPCTARLLLIVTAPVNVDVPPMLAVPDVEKAPVPSVSVLAPVTLTEFAHEETPETPSAPETFEVNKDVVPRAVMLPLNVLNPVPTVNVLEPLKVRELLKVDAPDTPNVPVTLVLTNDDVVP